MNIFKNLCNSNFAEIQEDFIERGKYYDFHINIEKCLQKLQSDNIANILNQRELPQVPEISEESESESETIINNDETYNDVDLPPAYEELQFGT